MKIRVRFHASIRDGTVHREPVLKVILDVDDPDNEEEVADEVSHHVRENLIEVAILDWELIREGA
jgi:hypothetical protein